MAGKGGGGAWKVAYADFVTAMMAFFLVMWLCSQNQEVRRSVADYFSDPMGSTEGGSEKKPQRTGSVSEHISSGTVPSQEKVSLGKGRRSHTTMRIHSPATKMVADWLILDKTVNVYWQKQAKDQREAARWTEAVKLKKKSAHQVAVEKLAIQLKDEFLASVPAKTEGIYRDLLVDAFSEVNWRELAEDLLGAQ